MFSGIPRCLASDFVIMVHMDVPSVQTTHPQASSDFVTCDHDHDHDTVGVGGGGGVRGAD
eukprot:m.32097 g.32097  ORF g.32097 m.32097 type:complete len:60 (-) comp12396_c0_seq1:1313-1492(-)